MRFVVRPSDAGDFLKERVAWDILSTTALHGVQVPEVIDLSGCKHLKPYSLACLAALGARSNRTAQLILPEDFNCRNHILRFGLHRWFAELSLPSLSPRSTSVEIRNLTNAPGSFSSDAMSVWERELGGLAVAHRRAFADHLDEMILNALGHSASPVGCFVAGQAFPQSNHVDVTILDLGRTILSHLSANPQYAHIATDADAIREAFIDGVTGTPPGGVNLLGQPNSGSGLTGLAKFCDSGNGVLTIVSGTACISRFERGERYCPINTRFQGTLVNVRFFTRIQLPDPTDDAIMW